MKAIVICEESQAVCIALRNKGVEAYSCDLQECSGGHPEWHFRMDAFDAIKLDYWDLAILHPPCTYTALCGNRWYHDSPLRKEGIEFCKLIWEEAKENSKGVALEQPKTIMQRWIGQRTQTIHPWQFGHEECKETWLWLHNLPLLKSTNVVGPPPEDPEKRKHWEKVFRMPRTEDRGKLRSKTYPGIARAIADQWGSKELIQSRTTQTELFT